jgi:hypothetical protein
MTCGKILGIEILNEGSGISVDDSVSEAQATFVARAVEPMQAVQSNFISTVGGNNQVPSSCRTTKASRVAREGRQPVPATPAAPLPGAPGKRNALTGRDWFLQAGLRIRYPDWLVFIFTGSVACFFAGRVGLYILSVFADE